MKFYLSSYKLGNETEYLLKMARKGKIAYISNALDFENVDVARRKKHESKDMKSLRNLGLEVELLDLREYFGKKDELKRLLLSQGAIFISGGNTYILRQAMRLSGLDEILRELKNTDFLYAGYSAAGCVLSPSLRNYQIVDDPDQLPYKQIEQTIWDGLGLIDYAFMPHWDSDHPESEDVGKEIELCKKNNVPYKAVRDGEVVIIE
ncbi:Type 1 glutamine amidotransferase-like domain-containing protein [Patescibacteria group bacterium]